MKRDRKIIDVIVKSGFITHSIARLKKTTIRGEREEGENNEGVTLREKILLLTVIEIMMQRKGWDGSEEEIGRISDDIENECIEHIESMQETEEKRGRIEDEENE